MGDVNKNHEQDEVYWAQLQEVTWTTNRDQFRAMKERDGRIDPRPII
jgi:hypothetical protein